MNANKVTFLNQKYTLICRNLCFPKFTTRWWITTKIILNLLPIFTSKMIQKNFSIHYKISFQFLWEIVKILLKSNIVAICHPFKIFIAYSSEIKHKTALPKLFHNWLYSSMTFWKYYAMIMLVIYINEISI